MHSLNFLVWIWRMTVHTWNTSYSAKIPQLGTSNSFAPITQQDSTRSYFKIYQFANLKMHESGTETPSQGKSPARLVPVTLRLSELCEYSCLTEIRRRMPFPNALPLHSNSFRDGQTTSSHHLHLFIFSTLISSRVSDLTLTALKTSTFSVEAFFQSRFLADRIISRSGFYQHQLPTLPQNRALSESQKVGSSGHHESTTSSNRQRFAQLKDLGSRVDRWGLAGLHIQEPFREMFFSLEFLFQR